MNISGYIVLILYLAGSGTSVIIYEECQPSHKISSEWIGHRTKITAWFQENIASADKDDPSKCNLSITLHFHHLSSSGNFDNFKVCEIMAKVLRSRDDKLDSKVIQFDTPVGPGWAEFTLSAESDIVLWYGSTVLVTMVANAIIKEITVSGNNVTIGCHERNLAWNVAQTESVVIPLSREDEDHNLSFFSNDESQPVLTLSNTVDSVRLGWDGSSVDDITRFSAEYRKSLPVSIQHLITISCQDFEDGVTCNILAGNENDNIKKISASERPTALSVTSGTQTPIYVFLHRKSQTLSFAPTTFQPEAPKEQDSSTGALVAVTVLTIICCALLTSVIVQFARYRQKTKMLEDIKHAMQEMQPLLGQESGHLIPSRRDPSETSLLMDPKMWEAVIKDDPRLVHYLLRQGVNPHKAETGKQTTAFLEAHILGRKDILQVMSLLTKASPTTLTNELIQSTLNVLEERMRKVFRAAKLGMYTGRRGVNQLLQAHSLPGTIMDHRGRSLVHYVVSVSSVDGRPAWEAKDIDKFLQDHECYVNACDFWGRTALHNLANRKRRNHSTPILWNDREQTSEEAWLDMAKILLRHGCDPRISDHQGISPIEIARENSHHELAELLKEECEKLGKIDYEEATNKFPNLAQSAKLGNTAKIQELLKSGVPFLPICARSDPLVEAIRCNQRAAVFLLLSAGSPLTNTSIEDLTPMEAAESTVGLPAFYPALMRKVYNDRLRAELEKVPCNDSSLRTGMEDYVKQITEKGSEAVWTFEKETLDERSKEARQLLVQAAELGLSLFCQLISMEDVYLHPSHNEEKPFSKALEKRHIDTQFALVRDLNMSPFTSTSAKIESLPTKLREDMLVSQLKILEVACQDLSDPYLNSGLQIREYIQSVKNISVTMEKKTDSEELQNPPDIFLYLVAQNGLDFILNILLSKCKKIDINTVIEDFSQSTLLHVASMHGRLNMIEFLIYHGANMVMLTLGGYTAAHIAAMKGHEESLTFIEEYMKSKHLDVGIKCNLGFTARELLAKYTEVCRRSRFPCMSHRDALFVLNESGDANKAYEILRRKGERLSIKTLEGLFSAAKACAVPQKEMADILNIAEQETKRLCENLHESEFEGKLLLVRSLQEGFEAIGISHVNFILELSKFQSLYDTSTIKLAVMDDICGVEIKSETDPELFKGSAVLNRFSAAMRLALMNYKPSPNVSFVPPYLKTEVSGVTIYLNVNVHKGNEYMPLAIHVVPVIPVRPPEELKTALPPNCNADIVHLHTGNAQGTWICRHYFAEINAFANLGEFAKEVWTIISFIRKLLDLCVWAPRFDTKHSDVSWHTLSVGVLHIQARTIKELFLREVNDKSVSWKKEEIYNRLLSIYKCAATKDAFRNWVPVKSVQSYFIPHHSLPITDVVCGIIKYLEELQGIYTNEILHKSQQWQQELLQQQ